jgi:hypothetical protein
MGNDYYFFSSMPGVDLPGVVAQQNAPAPHIEK